MIQSVCDSRDDLLGQAAGEFFEAAARGESPSIDDYARRYPHIAEDILRVFPALALVGDSTAGTEPLAPFTDANVRKQLGDFRIMREIGRGGMGIVYEAEQLSLGRRVALKVLPFAAVLDDKAIARFKNEARAAATLDHPHIVPVFAVGNERGVYYYAMALVEGRTLAEIVDHLRTATTRGYARGYASSPTTKSGSESACKKNEPEDLATRQSEIDTAVAALSTLPAFDSREHHRSVARLGVQAAEALHHAHERGIVHRDVKPGNLMVDATGKLSVTDFGLARIESEAGMTMTGDVVGTIRYMAPEQALANRTVVDQRADVYSLGATLYELVTLQPVFPGSNRNELLRQIADKDPMPPRKLNRAIPIDLQTILIKALQKEPADRYRTAGELAEDLGAFLKHQPIAARAPTTVDRAMKWFRRHAVAAWAGILALLLTAIGLAATALLISNARDDAVAAQRNAEAEAKRAEQNLELSLEAIDNIYGDLVGKQLADVPRSTRVREQFLRESLQFYERFARQNRLNKESWPETARACLAAGRIHVQLEQLPDAVEAFDTALDIYAELRRQFPHEAQYVYQAAEVITEIGSARIRQGWVDESIEALTAAVRALEPGGDPANAESLAAQLASDKHAVHVANAYHRLGEAYLFAGRYEDADRAMFRAVRLRSGLVERHAKNSAFEHALAVTLGRQALLEHATGQDEQAIELVVRAIAHDERALQQSPQSVASRRSLRHHYHLLGSLRLSQDGFDHAVEAHRNGNRLAVELADDFPEVVEDQISVAFSHFSLASALLESGRLDEAAISFRTCLSCWQRRIKARSLTTLHDATSCHFGAIQLDQQPDPVATFRSTADRLLDLKPWTAQLDRVSSELDVMPAELVEGLSDRELAERLDERAGRNSLEDVRPGPAEFYQGFSRVIDALSRDDLTAARTHLELAIESETKALQQVNELFANDPVTRLYVKSVRFLLGHAQALQQLGQNIADQEQVEDEA